MLIFLIFLHKGSIILVDKLKTHGVTEMQNTTDTLYYSRTETEQSVVIVWKPFSTYSTYTFLAIALIGVFSSITPLSLGAFLLLIVNAVVYSTVCKEVKNEINEASRNSYVQVKGNKFSLSSPLTVSIAKKWSAAVTIHESSSTKRVSTGQRVFFGFLTALFLILGLFVFSAFTTGVRQGAYVGSLIILLVFALVFFLLAFLCFRKTTK